MHTFAEIYVHSYVNSLKPGARAVLPNMVHYVPGETFIPHLSKKQSISRIMDVIIWTGDPFLLWNPQTWVTTATRLAMMASVTSFCFRKHLPPVSTWHGGVAWDSGLPHSHRPLIQQCDYWAPSPTSVQLPQLQNANICSIIKALLYSADQGLTLWPFPPLDLNDLSSRAERLEY